MNNQLMQYKEEGNLYLSDRHLDHSVSCDFSRSLIHWSLIRALV